MLAGDNGVEQLRHGIFESLERTVFDLPQIAFAFHE